MYAWNTTVEDTSAILDFHPYSDGSASSGWAPYFEDIGFWSGQPGVDSFGKNSVHITEYSGASVTFRFEGTAIYLYGTQNCSYSVTVDSQPASIPFQSSLPDGMLFWQDNLSASTHTVSLTANPEPDNNQQLAFDKAVFTNIGINATGISPVLIDNQNVTSVQYTGDWKNQSFYNIPSDSSPSPYFEKSNPKDAVSITFTGGAAVAINGARDWGHWTYNVTMDGAVSPVYNASTWWLMGDTVLFYQSNLDPQKTHTVQLANLGTPGDKLSLNYFTVYVPNGTAFNVSSASASPVPSGNTSATTPSPMTISPPAHSKTNVGIIVGPVVAGVVVLGAIIVALFFWLRPRRGAAPIMSDHTAGPADPSPAVAPYPQSMPQAAWNKEDEAGHPLAEMEVLTYPPVMQHQGDRQPPFAPIRLHSSASDPPAQSLASLAPGDSPSDAQPSRSVSRSTSTARLNDARVSPSSPRLNFEQIVELVVQRIGVRTGVSNESEAPPPEYVE